MVAACRLLGVLSVAGDGSAGSANTYIHGTWLAALAPLARPAASPPSPVLAPLATPVARVCGGGQGSDEGAAPSSPGVLPVGEKWQLRSRSFKSDTGGEAEAR